MGHNVQVHSLNVVLQITREFQGDDPKREYNVSLFSISFVNSCHSVLLIYVFSMFVQVKEQKQYKKIHLTLESRLQ